MANAADWVSGMSARCATYGSNPTVLYHGQRMTFAIFAAVPA